jgi:hypothetical protein
MKKKVPAGKKAKPSSHPKKSNAPAILILLGVVVVVSAFAFRSRKPGLVAAEEAYKARPAGQVAFNKDIAPIVFQNCSMCHRPGQSAPFSLLAYADVKKRADDIAQVTEKRLMPPWLPEPGHGKFLGERRLSAEQIGLIQQWVREGATEGKASDLPPAPQWNGDWQLGKPDLVVTMPQPYTLAAEGRDVYRNFVLPVSIPTTKFVRAVEVRPGNPKIVHHAFVKVDKTQQSRAVDARDEEVGFPGMNAPAEMPDGHFLGWQPGRLPMEAPKGLAWRLEPGNDIVFQTHLNPSGKPETLQANIGLYFTDQAPTNRCFKMTLASFILDIPAGEPNYVAEDNFKLPVDVQVIAVLPHAHYLAKEMHGWATLPSGEKKEMLLIKQWDFNWQGDYRYAEPVFLPSGTTLSMRYTYDNSTNNTRNPNKPPKAVSYGPQSSDEMGELWFQLLPRSAADLELLNNAYGEKLNRQFLESDQYALRKNPNDAKAHVGVGQALYQRNKLDEAESHFLAAARAQPDLASAYYNLGLVYRRRNQTAQARQAFMNVLRIDPKDAKACGNLGYICLEQGDARGAQDFFVEALRLNPADDVAREGLAVAMKSLGK